MGDKRTVTLKRPLTITNHEGTLEFGNRADVLPAGQTISLLYFGHSGKAHLADRLATSVHDIDVMWAAAAAPCPHAGADSDGDDYTFVTFPVCRRFPGDHGTTVFNWCRGDACRCPSSKVRAESAAALEEQKTAPTL